MTNRKIKEMMRDIDPKYQQRANERAAAVQHVSRRSRIPTLLVCGAAATCAVFAAAIILPRLKAEQMEIAASESQNEYAEDSEYGIVTENVEAAPIPDFSEDTIRLMSAAYAPYVLEIPKEKQQELASALMNAAWTKCDPDLPVPDGENDSVFVYNNGDSYRLRVYSDNTVDVEQNGEVTRWQLSDGVCDAIHKAAHPAQPAPNESFAENPLTGHLTWCAEDTLNAADIWQNTNVAAKACDMTTKDGVFYKMCNTMDYYNRVSCVTVSGTRPEGSQFNADRSTLRADLNAGKASEILEYFYSADADALMNGCEGCTRDESGMFITAKDGEKFYSATEYNHACHVDRHIIHRIDCPPVEKDQLRPDEMEFDDYDFYNSRRQILEGMGLNSFEWSKLVLGYLYDFDTWDIVGTETVNGRNCVHIKGKANDKFIFKEFVSDFDMYTDEETGVLVKLLGYNRNGALSHFVNTLDLKFEDDAEPFELPDFSDYEVFEAKEPAYVAQPAEDSQDGAAENPDALPSGSVVPAPVQEPAVDPANG